MIGLSYDWVYALVGFLIMLGILGGIGINKPRGMSVKMWCVGYLAVALGFDALVVARFSWSIILGLPICLLVFPQVPQQA